MVKLDVGKNKKQKCLPSYSINTLFKLILRKGFFHEALFVLFLKPVDFIKLYSELQVLPYYFAMFVKFYCTIKL